MKTAIFFGFPKFYVGKYVKVCKDERSKSTSFL